MKIIPYDSKYRDDMIFMVLQAKDVLGRVPRINDDLLNVETVYLAAGDMFWLAIDDSDRVVGCVGYSSVSGTSDAVLHRLYVKADKKRQGIGTALLQTAEAYMKEHGKTAVHVHLGAPKAQWFESYAFYAKHGYAEYEPRYWKKILTSDR
ncbi:MAG: GNAT family N-acetyltransferase [Clostridia bacterium]|nr:GNAT family N-acetyltransferase [Clostridia bacterium]